MITSLDFVGIPSTDADRSRTFYVDTLGLRPDANGHYEFWVGETCFGIWEPQKMGMTFTPQKNAHLALHVEDVAAARATLEAKGVTFFGEIFDTGVCHMAFFADPDGNDLMLHNRYAPYEKAGEEAGELIPAETSPANEMPGIVPRRPRRAARRVAR